MQTTLPADLAQRLCDSLDAGLAAAAERCPGEPGGRQPVHTVYGGGHLFAADTAAKLGELARQSLRRFAPDPASLGEVVGVADPALAARIRQRVEEKLRREPVEDFRIDFEDGYGQRPDREEDGHAVAAALEVARGLAAGSLPPFVGIRVKPLSGELRRRSLRTLDLFLTRLLQEAGRLPDGFVVTLPKITFAEQVAVTATALGELEARLGLAAGAVPIELMVETPQSIFAADGSVALPGLVAAANGRCRGAHFGTYDYTASMGITAAHQVMTHPTCEHAKQVMKVALAGSGVTLSDGATNVLPVAPHRAPPGGELSASQEEENRRSVRAAWRLHAGHVRSSLVGGFYQGWDLHPAQLVTRYGALYRFFLEGLDEASERLANFVRQAAKATLVGDVFDDAATGQGLLNYFLRAIGCGAVEEAEVESRTGLSRLELESRSFVAILEARRRDAPS